VSKPSRLLLALFLFGVSFGYVEAAVVVYLRPLYEPFHERAHPGHTPGDLFPLLRLDELQAAGEPLRLLRVELVREAATLVMLASIALTVARSFRTWFAGFLIAFGVWDVFYYVFLKLLLDWPDSLLAWDLLFLIPVPWAAPVAAPLLVAVSMVAAGTILIRREAAGRPLALGPAEWGAVVVGGLILIAAFCWDWRNLLAGGRPQPFNWPLFWVGLALGLGGFLRALRSADAIPAVAQAPA
jgi:hypothetical protein